MSQAVWSFNANPRYWARLMRDGADALVERLCRPFYLRGPQLVLKSHSDDLTVDIAVSSAEMYLL